MEQIRRLESEMDFLKNEHFASPVVCDSVQPSLDQSSHKDSEDSGKKSVINSFNKGGNKDVHLSKQMKLIPLFLKRIFHILSSGEKEKEYHLLLHQVKTVHFDKPNSVFFLEVVSCFPSSTTLFLLNVSR
ncbi:unnamed protein product [Rangifer tarandus platyrhynchus]|uniref:Uncharacterized protein n=2 Tax=Rangifer tarandus platyrhynchus TaxID=3082113 RepID=A0ABN8ZTW0_RANTA|nr:unnamed protein product [Rangifer tarandus platyrhynchus]